MGTTQNFFEKWGLETPKAILDKMGASAEYEKAVDDADVKTNGKGKAKNGKPLPAPDKEIKVMITLMYSEKQEAQFRKMEEILSKQFKTEDIHDTVLKAFQKLTSKK